MEIRNRKNFIKYKLTNFYNKKLKDIFSKISDKIISLSNVPIPTSHKTLSLNKKQYIKNLLKEGDILLTSNDKYPQWQIGEKLLLNSNWTHTGVYIGNGKVIDAQTFQDYGEVEKISIDDFLDVEHVAILRPKFKNKIQKENFLEYVKSSVGKPYDFDFNLKDDDKLYCSELPYTGLKKSGFNVNSLKVKHTFLGDIVVPQSFMRSKDFNLIYKTENSFIKNQLSHLPFIINATLKGALAGFSLYCLTHSNSISLITAGLITGIKISKDLKKLYDLENST